MDRKILIVDDEPNIVDILKINLQKDGFETIEAYDGAEGVEKAYSETPTLFCLTLCCLRWTVLRHAKK